MSASSYLESRRLARYAKEREDQAAAAEVPDDERWNHQIHYHRVLLDALPPSSHRVLDVGCGEGLFTRELARRADLVIGIDRDQPSIALAHARDAAPNVAYTVADLLDAPFAPASFDAVFCVMALHHVDEAGALSRLAALVRPGGVLGVIGIARSTIADLPWDAAGFVITRVHRLRTPEWTQPAPMCWPPPSSFRQVRENAAHTLPGCEYRRHPLFRYTVIWTKP